MSGRRITVTFTSKELSDVFECLETMKGMMGAMDDDFNRECDTGNKSFHKALKRSGFKIEARDYSNSNLKP
jgi:hypothetical protein